jgi:hypothetical protein
MELQVVKRQVAAGIKHPAFRPAETFPEKATFSKRTWWCEYMSMYLESRLHGSMQCHISL